MLHGKDLAAHDHAEHIEVQVGNSHRLAAERPAENQIARLLRRACIGLLFALRCGNRRGRLGIFERLAADALSLVKQRPPLKLRAGNKFERRLHAEMGKQEFLCLGRVLFQLLLAVGHQTHAYPLARKRKFRPGKACRCGRPSAHEHPHKIRRVERLDRLRGILRQNRQTLQAIPVFQHGLKLLDCLLRYVAFRFQRDFDASGLAVDLRAGDLRAGDRLGQLGIRKQL